MMSSIDIVKGAPRSFSAYVHCKHQLHILESLRPSLQPRNMYGRQLGMEFKNRQTSFWKWPSVAAAAAYARATSPWVGYNSCRRRAMTSILESYSYLELVTTQQRSLAMTDPWWRISSRRRKYVFFSPRPRLDLVSIFQLIWSALPL